MTASSAAALAPEWRRAFAWIEARLGGRIVRAERQPRWRPAWLLDLERDGERLPLYFRGDRGETDHGAYALEHEMRVLRVLEAQGIPVPHVHAFCPDPRGIVMERSPGRASLATASSAGEREAVLDDYVAILARMHALDLAPFEAIGMRRPHGPEALALLDFDVWEQGYRRRKRRAEPAVEFGIRWVRRNAPCDRRRAAFVCADAGQFLFEDGRVTAVLDLELACLGDPAADLGGMRGRDLSEPLGDLPRAFDRYEMLTGEPLDRAAIGFHSARFNLVTPMAVSHLVAAPPAGLDVVQYQAWSLVWTRTALEAIGERIGLDLAPPALAPVVAPPAASATDFGAYETRAAARQALYRDRLASLGPALDAEYLDDAGRLLGRSFAERAAADAAVEQLVLAAGPARDAELLGFLHRRVCRDEGILAPAAPELAGARLQPLR